jgi:hypothetical protein
MYRIIVDSECAKAAAVMRVFGQLDLPVINPHAVAYELPLSDEPQAVYVIDVSRLSQAQIDRATNHYMQKHGMLEDEVRDAMQYGIPIHADYVTSVVIRSI